MGLSKDRNSESSWETNWKPTCELRNVERQDKRVTKDAYETKLVLQQKWIREVGSKGCKGIQHKWEDIPTKMWREDYDRK